jgi:N-glycosylase/DNA lyase
MEEDEENEDMNKDDTWSYFVKYCPMKRVYEFQRSFQSYLSRMKKGSIANKKSS